MRRLVAVLWVCALAVAGALLAGCGREEKEAGPVYDPHYIASEADKGNLAPLKELNAACGLEVERTAKRGIACQAQDRVGELRQPMKLQF